MSKRKPFLLPAVLALGAVLSGCASHRRVVVYAPSPPPAAITDTVTVSPGPGYFWVPGRHVWVNGVFEWTPGRWERVPRGRHEWIPGHWAHDRHGWYWIEGHWR